MEDESAKRFVLNFTDRINCFWTEDNYIAKIPTLSECNYLTRMEGESFEYLDEVGLLGNSSSHRKIIETIVIIKLNV